MESIKLSPKILLPKGLRLTLSDEFGIPSAFKEAIKFAVLGHATMHQLANNIPAASGASRFAVLGKLVQPPRGRGCKRYHNSLAFHFR